MINKMIRNDSQVINMESNQCIDGNEAKKRPFHRKTMFDTMPVESKTFIPRPYQVEIFEMAKQRNTIVCLGTGTGKTFIAVMLIDHYSHQLRDDYAETGKRTVVIVPKCPLVSQQAKVIRHHLNLNVGEYIGDMNRGTCDTWDKSFWVEELNKNHVLVMTAEIFRMMITHGIMSLSKVNLLILDEAHWAIKNHPYREIMCCFDDCEEPPRVLGLSASLINCKAKPKDLRKLIGNLEKTLRANCETASDLRTVSKCGTKPEEVIWYYSPPKSIYKNNNIVKAVEHLESLIHFLLDFNHESIDKGPTSINQMRKCLGTTAYILGSMGYWCCTQVSQLYITEFAETIAMFSSSDPIYSGLLSAATSVLQYLRATINSILDNYIRRDRLTKFSSPKLFCLMDILKEYKPIEDDNQPNPNDATSKPLCGIIFVERRAVVRVLCMWLQELSAAYPEEFGFLKVEFVLGHGGNSSGMGSRMSSKRQEDALSRFRKHECNLLIATSVLEEGLDVPRCNLVVRYDMPKSFREYMQSKGRARAEKARYIMLIENEEKTKVEMKSMLTEFVEIEDILLKSCNRKESLTLDQDENDESAEDILPPFMPIKGDGAPRVTINSAIALVNRYCLKLPSDSFTKLAPHCLVEEINGGFQCSISLPINSPIREIIVGQPMQNKKLAKKAAALEVCKRLHKEGELDDNLLPVGKEGIKDAVELGLEPYDEESERGLKGHARPGTTKRRQYYFKRIASVLQGLPPQPHTVCRLYVFIMKLTCPIPEEQNTRGRKITDPADTPRCFGFITNNKVPPVPSFPVFTRSGEVLVSFEETNEFVTFTEEELGRLEKFHHFVFHNVLRLDKDLVQFSLRKAQCSFSVVPVLVGNDEKCETKATIDWKFIEKVEKYENTDENEITDDQRKYFVFEKSVYEDAVIKPWYRRNKVQFYFYVAEITKLTPRSPFPDAGHDSFEEYYKDKYNLQIMNLDQFLLDVDHTSARLNLLTPRYVNRKGMTLPMSTQKTKKSKRENLQEKQILVPELCIVHPFPASFWRKAVCLPCILYRLNSLLVAEELRREVAISIGVGLVELPAGDRWPQLDFGWTLADVLTQTNEPQPLAVEESDGFKVEDWNTSYHAEEAVKQQNEEKTDAMKSDSDFVIDFFDPSKCNLDDKEDKPEEDFYDHELEMNMNPDDIDKLLKGETFTYSFGAWEDKTLKPKNKEKKIRELDDKGNPVDDYDDDDDSESCFRVGSPSRFENGNSNWDTGWDEECTQVFDIGLPGLTSISGPKGFNLQGLSKDLATCQEENWDAFDEYDSDEELPDEDEEAAEFDPYYEKKSSNVSSVANKIKREELVNDLLSNGLMVDQPFTSPSEDTDLVIFDEVKPIDENNGEQNNEESIDINFEDYFSVVESRKENEECYEKESEEEELCIQLSKCMHILKNEEIVPSFDIIENAVNNEIDKSAKKDNEIRKDKEQPNNPEPSFGELLTNREAVDVPDSNFRFDPYKADDAQSEGPNPCAILQALTMSNASDGINLERLETVGDSFLKYAVTAFLYCFCPSIHEGKLSYLRSRQISNYNLYRLGKRKGFGELMVATKFEPNDNWLPPGFMVPTGLEQALIDTGNDTAFDTRALKCVDWTKLTEEEMRDQLVKLKSQFTSNPLKQLETFSDVDIVAATSQSIPYNILTQHSIPDKSIADCVEALIGAYLISSGAKGAMLFMKWLGLKVMPDDIDSLNINPDDPFWHWLPKPKSPLLFDDLQAKGQLKRLYLGSGLDRFEKDILRYEFRDKAYLVQAFTHNSFCDNHVTDCYQRLEFLGDAVLDFLITRHLYEDPQKHSPGTLTDLRSALVNNTFFATLAVRYEFQKFLKVSSCDLFRVVTKFVEQCMSNKVTVVGDENLYMAESECEYSEEVEVPKALGDIFESVAGAIFLDSGMSLDAVWRVYYEMMKPEIERFSKKPPKSHIRELLEAQPQNAVFGKPEVIPGRKVRVVVEVFNEGKFVGIGRNKRLAKCTAAKRALRALRAKQAA